MNPNHQKFITEYLATGDKIEAYRKAYPSAKESSLTNAANRLMQREDVAAIIRQSEERAMKKAEAALEKRVKAELLDLYETQLLLTQIARGQHTTTKPVKENGNWTTIDVKPTHNIILRAINTFFRLNGNNKPGTLRTNNKQPEADATQNSGMQVNIPPEPARSIYPHPFGNIYPPKYPGPYYDPGDPNTKEKMKKLALQPLTANHTPETITTNNNNQSRHSASRKHSGEESPKPLQSASSQQTIKTATSQDIAPFTRNDELLLITTNNNLQQHKTTPPSEGGMPAGRGGHTQHGLTQTTTQNPEKQQHPKQKFSPYVQRMLLCDKLRKEGWQTLEEAGNEVYETFIRNQCSTTHKMLKQFQKLRNARNLPPDERAQVEKETGWQYHPEHSFMLKRKRH